ncbi:MAG: hypothetical protein IJM63_00945, partial [Solobacterium sp.]|nr:hypothetical protein [Solobacterium sp.]
DGREAARFSGSCQVLLRKRKEKKMPQLNWSTLLKHSICQTAKVTCIGFHAGDFFVCDDEFFQLFTICSDFIHFPHRLRL